MEKPTFTHDLLKTKVLYVSDLDGTLLDPTSQVSAESVRLLNESIEAGAHFTIATARTPATLIGLMRDVNLRLPGVVMTGAALYNFSERRFSRLQFMPPGVTDRLVKLYRKHDTGTFIYTFADDMLKVYHIGELNELEKGFISQRAHTGVKRFIVPPCGESPLPANLDNTLLLYSVQPWLRAKAVYDDIIREKTPVTPLCYHDNFGDDWGQLEMFSPTANKAAAVEDIASQIGAGRIVAFGDNVNDIPLFRLADVGIAMGNAVDELKEIASEVIASNDTPAVADFIRRHTI
ncbi:MAG: HAD-IIB family hydrolase [Bacteroidales bacterium]|nr:HAD-IIB family hydrolase [Bacteroidales bacterium]